MQKFEPIDDVPAPRPIREKTKSGEHIHSDKWRRCVKHVQGRKGGENYNAYAVCMSSIGKEGSLRRGHGGSAEANVPVVAEKGFSDAAPGSGGRFKACQATGKSAALCAHIGRQKYGGHQMSAWAAKNRGRSREVEAEMDAVVEDLVKEYNPYHEPAGKPTGGQFTSKGGAGGAGGKKLSKEEFFIKYPSDEISGYGRAGLDKAETERFMGRGMARKEFPDAAAFFKKYPMQDIAAGGGKKLSKEEFLKKYPDTDFAKSQGTYAMYPGGGIKPRTSTAPDLRNRFDPSKGEGGLISRAGRSAKAGFEAVFGNPEEREYVRGELLWTGKQMLGDVRSAAGRAGRGIKRIGRALSPNSLYSNPMKRYKNKKYSWEE